MSNLQINKKLCLMLVAASFGPTTAFFHEFNIISFGQSVSLLPLLVIVFAALFGVLVGLKIGRRSYKRLSWLAVIPNILVIVFYGFLLLFFGLGGTR